MNKFLKSYDVNSVTSKHLKVLMTKIAPYGYLFICVKFQGQIIMKISIL